MRKKHYEVTDINEMVAIMEKCLVCRIALNDGDHPYIVPLNFGYSFDGGVVTIYFHSANVGKKIDMLKANGKVGFELDTSHRVVPADVPCDFAMEYESIIGSGEITFLDDSEKPYGFQCIMRHYDKSKEYSEFDPKIVAATNVMKLTIKEMTCKRIKK